MKRFYDGVKKVLRKVLELLGPVLAIYRLAREILERIERK